MADLNRDQYTQVILNDGDLLDNSPAEPLLDDLSLLRHREYDREGKTLLAREKTAKLFAQSGRQHGDRALNEVHAGSTLASIAIKCSVGLYEVGDVRDVNTNVVGAVLVNLDGDGIIQILRGIGVDSEDALATQVLANLKLALRNAEVSVSNNRSLSMRNQVTYVQGIGGRHFMTFSVKSSVGKLQSFRRALVSTSMSPMGPSSSTRVPKGWRELIGCMQVSYKFLQVAWGHLRDA